MKLDFCKSYNNTQLNQIAMSNEETRNLTGLVAKTRALFESNQNLNQQQKNFKFSTPQNLKSKQQENILMKQSYSACNINQESKSLSKSCSVESESDFNSNKENNTVSNKPSLLRSKKSDSKNFIFKKSYSSNRISTCSNEDEQEENLTLKIQNKSTSNILLNKSEEISKELNIPLSVKQARACFENLLKQNSEKTFKSRIDLVINSNINSNISSNNSNNMHKYSTPIKPCISNKLPDMINSLTSSSSSSNSSDSSSVFNSNRHSSVSSSSSSSSCESTPRSSTDRKVSKINVADRIRKLEAIKSVEIIHKSDYYKLNQDDEQKQTMISSMTSSTSSSSSLSSAENNKNLTPSPKPIIKYAQSSKFIQLYQKQMEISCISSPNNNYRKLEDIINEADNSIKQKQDCQNQKEEKKLKSILRKNPKQDLDNSSIITTVTTSTPDILIETNKQTNQSFSSSSSCSSPSSSVIVLNNNNNNSNNNNNNNTSKQNLPKPQGIEQQEESIKVDNSSCVLPSKLRQRTQSLTNQTQSNTININISPSNLNKTTTPVRNVGSYIKNVSSSCSNSNNSGLVKRVTRNAVNAREALIRWCRKMTEEYDNVSINNFSSSWSDGLAFCALIHHFMPDEYDYYSLSDLDPRFNFDLAFKTAEKAGIISLLDVDDMIEMGNSPDWKCVFTYVHSIYQRFKDSC